MDARGRLQWSIDAWILPHSRAQSNLRLPPHPAHSPDDYNYQFHPIAAIFPLLEGDELNALAADIKANGLREPCWLYEGKILDGRNRKTACRMAGVEPSFRRFSGDRMTAIRFVCPPHCHRRPSHLQSRRTCSRSGRRCRVHRCWPTRRWRRSGILRRDRRHTAWLAPPSPPRLGSPGHHPGPDTWP